MKPPSPTFPSFVRVLLGRVVVAARETSREVYAEFSPRFAQRVAASFGEELVALVNAMGDRARREHLPAQMTPEQRAFVTEFCDVLQRYVTRASATPPPDSTRVSTYN